MNLNQLVGKIFYIMIEPAKPKYVISIRCTLSKYSGSENKRFKVNEKFIKLIFYL